MVPDRPAKRQRTGAQLRSTSPPTNVYVDDYCLGCVENSEGTLLEHVFSFP